MCVPQRMESAKADSNIKVERNKIDAAINFDLRFIGGTSGSRVVNSQNVLVYGMRYSRSFMTARPDATRSSAPAAMSVISARIGDRTRSVPASALINRSSTAVVEPNTVLCQPVRKR